MPMRMHIIFMGIHAIPFFHNDLIVYFLIYDSSNSFFPTNALINKIKTMACFSLCSCDDDWYVQEESSTLSFPSYYIDAEVTILRQHSSSPSKQSYSSVPQS